MIVLCFYLFNFLGELVLLVFLVFFYFLCMRAFSLSCLFRVGFNTDLVGVSIAFLTILVFFLIILSGSLDFFKKNNWSMFLRVVLLFLLFLVLLFFCGNFFVFYLLFEMAVLPVFLLIIGWGYRVNRAQAAIYMFLYTFVFSLPFLIFLLVLMMTGYGFRFFNIFYEFFSHKVGGIFWGSFLLVFLVKLPVFLLHMWLPKAHVEAPLVGSIVLAGVLLKLGGYGLYKRVCFFLCDLEVLSSVTSSFFLLGGVLVGFLCLRQVDLKSLIAYSSVVHMAPVVVCFFISRYGGLLAGLFIIFSHGLCSSCLFFLLNLSYYKLGRRSVLVNRGGVTIVPFFSFVWFIFCISNIGFPPSFNFFSELFVVLSVFMCSHYLVFLIFILMLLGGFYRVLLYVSFNHGQKKFFFQNFFIPQKSLLLVFLSLFYLFAFFLFVGLVLCS